MAGKTNKKKKADKIAIKSAAKMGVLSDKDLDNAVGGASNT